jgi:putative ABC transport system permease protein
MHGTRPPEQSSTGLAARQRLSTPALLPLALKLAWRDLRAGLRGFGVFIACLALGVAAIAAVASAARSVSDGLNREGRRVLGGDASFTLVHREATGPERAFLDARGQVSAMATMRAMLNAGDKGSALVELKAVDALYPTVGAFESRPDQPLPALLEARGEGDDKVYGAVADPLVLARLGLTLGERVRVGEAAFELRAEVVSEPDKVAAGVGLGPRLLVSEAALRASGLVQPGSLIRWTYRLAVPGDEAASSAALARIEADAKAELPDAGWEVRTRANADPRFARNIDRFSQFLTLVALTALLVGGVGVANAVRRFVDMKRLDFATLKALGAPGGRVVAIHLAEVMLVACIGVAIGLAIGGALPFLLAGALKDVLPFQLAPSIAWPELAGAAAYGLATALAFALAPLARAHDTPVSALFRDSIGETKARPRARYIMALAASVILLAGLTIGLAYDPRIAATYLGVMAGVFVALRVVALGITAAARRLPRPRSPAARLALANMHRPGALTPSLVLSLGLGVALLSALAFIDASLSRQLTQNLPQTAPSYFFIDIPNQRAAEFDRFIASQSPNAALTRVPMMRGRVTALNGVPADQVRAPDRASWILEGDRGITYASTLPEGSALVSGAWWGPDHRGEALVSFDHELAGALGLRLGDGVTVNVLGRQITARIANTRRVDWRSLGINFVMVFSPNTFAGAPHTHLATMTVPTPMTTAEEAALLRALGRDFQSVTAVRVKDALDAANDLVARLGFAIRATSLIAILASLLVLAGALAAGQRAKLYDAMILKTLGGTRARIIAAYSLEYGVTGLIAALFGVMAGAGAAWAVTTRAMNIGFVFVPGAAAGLAAAAILVALVFGLIGTLRILARKPAQYLRSL